MESVQAAGASRLRVRADARRAAPQPAAEGAAREVLVSYGEPVVDALAHFMRDPDEDIWVRRHIPATLAQIPSQKAVDVLTGALAEPDGFLRYKAVAGARAAAPHEAPLDVPARADRSARAHARAAATSTTCR